MTTTTAATGTRRQKTRDGKSTGGPTAAVPRPPSVTNPTKLRRRPLVMTLGVALVALCALAGYYLATSLGQTRQVVAFNAAAPIERGERIEADQLTIVDIPTGPTALQAVDASQLEALVGQYATAELQPGSLLTPTAYTSELTPPPGTSIVGIALGPHQMPTDPLHGGDEVRIVETPVSGGEPPVEDPRAIGATVVSSQAATMTDQIIVNVQVDTDDAAALAARAATGRVALVLDSREG